jgi:tRNA 5-methylaminomethyl-2-thiouridine biosynthesis bifunctional protein
MRELPSAELTWRDGHPFSGRFGDIYYSDDGIAETHHVFLDGIGVPDCWRDRREFTIVETGFGTGLNFLATWARWRETAGADARLNFVSVEGYPLDLEALTRTHEVLGPLRPLAEELRKKLPPRIGGFHTVDLDGGRVRLLLLYGEAEAMLQELIGDADAWFLDGFAPGKNPEMWSDTVFAEIARLSRPGARLATFTAAGRVRRALEAAGFAMEKRPTLRKRECLAGTFNGGDAGVTDRPWFAWPKPLAAGSRIAVVGAGIAGATAARALADGGFKVVVHEAGSGAASGASGTPAAVVQPRPLTGDGVDASFHAAAFRAAVDLYDTLGRAGHTVWRERGVLVLGRDAADAARYRRLAESGLLGPDAGEWIDASEASRRSGLAVDLPGTWFPTGGALDGEGVCRALLDGIEVRYDDAVTPEQALTSADAVLITVGHATSALANCTAIGLHANRGQLTQIAPDAWAAGQRAPVTYGGYLVTAPGGHMVGSTFRRINAPDNGAWRSPEPLDDASNLALLTSRLPAVDIARADAASAWVGLRATTEDRLPVLGPVPDPAGYAGAYARLRHGPGAGPFLAAPFRPGQYALAGLGTRGFLTAPLSAAVFAERLAGRPVALPGSALDAVHPARFLIRDLKRSRSGA